MQSTFIQPIELSLWLNTTSLKVNEFKSLKRVYVCGCVRAYAHAFTLTLGYIPIKLYMNKDNTGGGTFKYLFNV